MSIITSASTIADLDRQTKNLCISLLVRNHEPDDRVNIARQILTLQEERKTLLQDIMTRAYGSKGTNKEEE